MTDRRIFLRNASLMSLGGVLAATNNLSAAGVSSLSELNSRKDFGLQIYSLGGELAPDVPGGLKRLSQMGYSSIELAFYNAATGNVGEVPIAEFKKFADDAGLKITSSHVGLPIRGAWNNTSFEQSRDRWKRACDDHASIGCKYIIHPGDPPARSAEEAATVAGVFNEAGKVAKAAGISFGFHNHEHEFRLAAPGATERLPFRQRRPPEGAKMVMDAFIEGTDPSLVTFQLDVYWSVIGDQCPVAYMKKHPSRIKLLHIKDVNVLGESGMMNFQKIYETAYSIGIEYFIVEFEPSFPGGTLFEGVKLCADYLLKADFVR